MRVRAVAARGSEELLRRSLDVDVLKCPTYGGRLRILAAVTERDSVTRVLAHLGVPTEAPAVARARDPTDDAGDGQPCSSGGCSPNSWHSSAPSMTATPSR